MNTAHFHSYVPVFAHYLTRISHLVGMSSPAQLDAQLTPDGLSAVAHFAAAQGYVLRGLWPLMGREVPELDHISDGAGLVKLSDDTAQSLAELAEIDFEGAAAANVTHVAGDATLTQSAQTFISLYALPNFFFHLGMGYAILRQQGVDIGKQDFDGFHSYPRGFSFVTGVPEATQ